jgi:hypothetical protein
MLSSMMQELSIQRSALDPLSFVERLRGVGSDSHLRALIAGMEVVGSR